MAMNLEMDGAWVASKTAPGGERWDTSKVSVFFARGSLLVLPLVVSPLGSMAIAVGAEVVVGTEVTVLCGVYS